MEERISTRLSSAEGRRFAFTVGAAFMVMGGLLYWRSHSAGAAIAASLGALLAFAGVIVPGKLGPLFHGWMRLALLISKVTTPVMMGVIYFLVIAPFGLVRRLIRNPLARAPGTESLWVARGEAGGKSDLRRQF